METIHYDEMVDVLTNALSLTPEQAEIAREALVVAWHNKIAIVWTADEVSELGQRTNDRPLSAAECRDVLAYILDNHDTGVGVTESLVIETIAGLGYGRSDA